jgi:hypothetical protein
MQGTKELREKLATACRLLYMEGLMDHAGLAGARIPGTGNLLLPKVISKMWHYYLMKGQSTGILAGSSS